MKKLIKNPELFQGKRYLKTNNNYFEGYYYKNVNDKIGISFIPGISINKEHKKAFIQIITNNASYNVDYDINDFEYNDFPFYIKIANNYFSKDKIKIDINDEKQNLNINGFIEYTDINNIKKSILSPNIMGLFTYIPFMECNHAIVSMKSKINGIITLNNQEINLNDGIGYIEKDWGTSFPKSYIWIQGNNFNDSSVSFMLSIADIPFKIFKFTGLICSLIIDNKEYRFATYNNTKIMQYNVNKKILNIKLKKGRYTLNVKTKLSDGQKLTAPVKGKMEKNIYESISSIVSLTLKKDDNIIFADNSLNCGLEIVSE